MNTNELREKFLKYFEKQGHQRIASSSLIPNNDPSLLFTNAGMVQFKEVFLGKEQKNYTRATTAQRCVRAGGKHNDLENVGYTARHHTFFEMLGNFSFGDYFKVQAIQFAWDFLTKELKLPAKKLWVTVHQEDHEAENIWLSQMEIDPKRFSRCGDKDNFWSMGDTGPCGPCTEIFYDHGPEIPGGPPGSPDADGDRYVEIWNLVFMQYNRDQSGQMTSLPKPSVDTGMGLERISAVMQGVQSNYEIDIFQALIKFIANLAGVKDLNHSSLKVIADHIRSCAFLICDGVLPSNEGRGYVLRRIIRRAIRHGHQLGLKQVFFHQIVVPLVAEMGSAYPELMQHQSHIEAVLLREEEQFASTLEMGLHLLQTEIARLANKVIPGEIIFKLYDTYGFPPDLTGDIARERGLVLDLEGFEQAMTQQRQRSQLSSQFSVNYDEQLKLQGETEFTGYEKVSDQAIVNAIVKAGQIVDVIHPGETVSIVLNKTPFYAESGGQVGDSGHFYFPTGEFKVTDTQKHGLIFLHQGELIKGQLKIGDQVTAEVDSKRQDIMLNHSATHLLHAALRRVLGEHVLQKGSLVEAERLRFDFSHFEALNTEQLTAIEDLVNEQIRANLDCQIQIMSPEAAQSKGALALFGEKYGQQVRVLSMGDFSMELCGGTHVDHTGVIGLFKITAESGIAAGVRRLEAVTGKKALELVRHTALQLTQIADKLKTDSDHVLQKLEQLMKKERDQAKQIEQLQAKLASSSSQDLIEQVQNIHGIHVLATQIEGADSSALRATIDQLKTKLDPTIIILAGVKQQKIQLVASVSRICTDKIKAGDLLAFVAEQVGGKGGGRADLAQGGGSDLDALPAALKSVNNWIKERLSWL